MNYSDEQLIANYLKGDEKALEILIKNYLKSIYNFAYRYVNSSQEAEDITQEVFLRVWRNLKKFKAKKGSFKTWIFTIAKNASFDFLRKSRSASGGKKAAPFSEFTNEEGENILLETLADPLPNQSEILERKNNKQKINLVVENLPIQYKTLLFMYYNDHFNFREIAEILGEPLNTIKSRHRRAIIMLRKLLPAFDKN